MTGVIVYVGADEAGSLGLCLLLPAGQTMTISDPAEARRLADALHAAAAELIVRRELVERLGPAP
jgi:hypothetical protein